MGSIQDALKRAEEARDTARQEPSPPAPLVKSDAPTPTDPATPLSSVVKHHAGNLSVPSPMATPLTSAIARGVVSTADLSAQRAADAVMESYEPRVRWNLDPRLVVYHDKAGAIAEQYRTARNQLLAHNARIEPRMYIVTSSVGGEGKTLTAINLALSLAEIRSLKILLIDADLPHGALSRHLKCHNARGMSELLTGNQKAEVFIQPTPWPNLFVLPSGAVCRTRSAAALLRQPITRSTLRHVRNMFDVVLVDSPAAMKLPDAGILATAGDGVLLAVALGRTRRGHVLRTTRLFAAMNIPIRGCILLQAG